MKRVTVIAMAMAICVFAISTAVAQTNLGLKGIGFGVGVVDPQDVDMTMGLAVYGYMGTVHPNFGIDTYVGYWKYSEDALGFEASIRDISVGMRGKYMMHVNPTVTPFAGAGVGVHFLTADVSVPSINFGSIGSTPAFGLSETETRVGFDLGGGLLFDVSPRIALQADAWYTIVSDFNQLAMRGGMMFKL